MSSALKTAILLGGLSGLLILAGGAIGGQGGLVIAFAIALVMNIGSYWFSDKIVLRMYGATEVGPDHPLYRVTARLAQKAGLPMPRVYVIPEESPNAFATGRNPQHAAVAATEGILRLLPENELEGVIAHELSHVMHRDILISTVAATIAAAIMLLANMARFAAIFGGGSRDDRESGSNPLVLLAMAIMAPLAAMLIQMAISRQREFAADRAGAELVGTPTGLASALRHIDAGVKQIPMDASPATAHLFIMKPFSVGGLLSLFSSHPPTEARIQALMALPTTGR
jgi:heat shock protein HtpX